jgi:hypothetical protein
MRLEQLPTGHAPIAHTTASIIALANALRSEARLLADLVGVMRRQREAVAEDDLDAVDESVFATHRVLNTLGEARRRRRSVNSLLGESNDLSISALDEFFGGNLPDEVRDAAETLTDIARTLQREVDMNRRVLRQAIDSGDQYVRALCGVPVTHAADYSGTTSPTSGGAILDRRI